MAGLATGERKETGGSAAPGAASATTASVVANLAPGAGNGSFKLTRERPAGSAQGASALGVAAAQAAAAATSADAGVDAVASVDSVATGSPLRLAPVDTGIGNPGSTAAQSQSAAQPGGGAEALVERILQAQSQQHNSLRLQLHPLELGRLDVHLRWRNDELSLAFTTQQTAARDLIEGHLPHLRQLLQDMGIRLAGVDVRHDGSREGARDGWARGHDAGGGAMSGDAGSGAGGGEARSRQALAARAPGGYPVESADAGPAAGPSAAADRRGVDRGSIDAYA
ncbi:MAG: flagellar hook-length control protein FliK [Pseudomonadales bacterium]